MGYVLPTGHEEVAFYPSALHPSMGLLSSALSGPSCPNSAMCELQPFWKPRSPGRFDYVLVVPPR